jgi:hypothetical protein
LIAVALVLRPSRMPHGAHCPLVVKLIAGRSAQDEWRSPGRDARCCRRLLACIRGRPRIQGTSSRTAGDSGFGLFSGPDPSGGQALGTSRQSRSAVVQFAGPREDVAARSVRTLSRNHTERRGRSRRTHADPPIWRQFCVDWLTVRPNLNGRSAVSPGPSSHGPATFGWVTRLPAVCGCLPLPRPAFRVRSLSCAGPAPADARRAHAVISGRFELHPGRNMEPSERRVSGSSAGTKRPQLVVSGFGYLDVSALVRPLPCRVVRGESDERDPGCAGAGRGDGDGPGRGRGRFRPPVGFDVQGPAVPGIDVVRGGHCGAPGDEPADLAYRVGRSSR